jgi:dTDP-glucose pyrophosphorylase
MKKINSLGENSTTGRNYKFLILLGKDKKLLGTITDGDIRRSILAGKNLDSAVINSASLEPHYGVINEDIKNKDKLTSVLYDTYFLPIINKSKEVVSILVANNNAYNKKVSVLIMAGGFGKRLGNKTKNIPKPLLKKNGKPLIDHVFNIIQKSDYIEEVFISTHYLSGLLEEHIKSKTFNIPVSIVHEEKPLGTAGSLSLIKSDKENKIFLIINADLITNVDIDSLITFHGLSSNDATIAVARYSYKVPYGVIEYSSDGTFLELLEKPDIKKYVSAGIYVLSSKFKDLIPYNSAIDMPELINNGKKELLNIGVFPIHEQWSDIGRPEDL